MQAHSEHTKVRPPAVAGQFYSADPRRLRSHIEALLTKIPASSSASPKALIAPHAGYVYSGGVAATAFACLQGAAETIKRVVLIGPAHYVRLRGIAVPTVDAFETPLGRVRLDREALVAIGDLPSVTQSDAAHAPEHALEVEVPFLQTLLNGFTMVPLLVGQITPEGVADVRTRMLDSVWFGRSVRAQLLIVFLLINAIAALVAGGVTIFKAGAATRIEIAASMRLAQLMVGEAVQLIEQGIPAEQLLRTLPAQLRSVRHVRVGVRDAVGVAISGPPPRDDTRLPAPRWFAPLIGPPIEVHDVPVAVNGETVGTVEIVSEPNDEIAEVWENTVALAAIAGGTPCLCVLRTALEG